MRARASLGRRTWTFLERFLYSTRYELDATGGLQGPGGRLLKLPTVPHLDLGLLSRRSASTSADQTVSPCMRLWVCE